MPRVCLLRRIAEPLLAAAQQQPAAQQQLLTAAVGATARLLTTALARGPAPGHHTAACGCPSCAALRPSPHGPACGCGACAATGPSRRHGRGALTAGQTRSYRCCPGLDGTPPDRVTIEYDPEDVDTYIQIADAIEAAFPNIVVDGNVDTDGRPGSFEIVSNATGAVVFSRLSAGGAAPQAAAIVAALEADGAAAGGACEVAPGGAAGQQQ